MESALRKALSDTGRSFGFTLATAVRSVVVPAGAVLLMAYVRGFEYAVNAATDIVLYILAFCVLAVIPVFLWNLWLAPYRLMHERLDKAIAANKLQSDPETSHPGPVDVSAYDGTSQFKLGDAACLWVGIGPHCPITDRTAAGMFTKLSGAVRKGQVAAHFGMGPALAAIGGRPWWPHYDQPVSAIALRRYADQIGDVPPFLASVQIPDTDEDNPPPSAENRHESLDTRDAVG